VCRGLLPLGPKGILSEVSEHPRKLLSKRDQRKVTAKRAARKKKRADAEGRRYWRENISPVSVTIDASLEDEICSAGPVKRGSTAALRQERGEVSCGMEPASPAVTGR
jgi:hypothetical protein